MEKGEALTDIRFKENGPTVLLVVGVNGVGKTTTIAKLANRYLSKGKSVLLVAGDTFRAGATEQLQIWADRLGVTLVKGKYDSDPSSVAYDGMIKAKNENVDLVIVDVAGRLQTKQYLMDELSKMKRVIGKVIPDAPHETFLIIEATTGQNGVVQAKAFKEVNDLTGIVITKMDGTSKGGIILAIRDELGVPVRFIGLGEKMDDLEEFDLDKYLYGLLIGDEEE
jgi:fused signal recognition particle receptor